MGSPLPGIFRDRLAFRNMVVHDMVGMEILLKDILSSFIEAIGVLSIFLAGYAIMSYFEEKEYGQLGQLFSIILMLLLGFIIFLIINLTIGV